jgi:hypothetical protein
MSNRLAKMRDGERVSHATVHEEMLADMERDLRQMVRAYNGTARAAKELLEALVIARENGVKACDELEHELAIRLPKSA